jgi:hypothetical protein
LKEITELKAASNLKQKSWLMNKSTLIIVILVWFVSFVAVCGVIWSNTIWHGVISLLLWFISFILFWANMISRTTLQEQQHK